MKPRLTIEERILLHRLLDADNEAAPPPELADWLEHPAVAAALMNLANAVRTARPAMSLPEGGDQPASAEEESLVPPPSGELSKLAPVTVYLLIDTSGSMRGEPIEAVRVGLESLLIALRQEPKFEERLHLTLITFDREARVLIPRTDLARFELPGIETPKTGPTHTGEALRILCEQIDEGAQQGFPPTESVVFVMTDGRPSDAYLYEPMIKQVHQRRPRLVMACAVGPKAVEVREALLPLTDHVGFMDRMDVACFQALFSWVTDSLTTLADEGPNVAAELPRPPEQIGIVSL